MVREREIRWRGEVWSLELKRGSASLTGADFIVTMRELEVLMLRSGGFSYKQVGFLLGVSPMTVKNHVSHVLENQYDMTNEYLSATAIIGRLYARQILYPISYLGLLANVEEMRQERKEDKFWSGER